VTPGILGVKSEGGSDLDFGLDCGLIGGFGTGASWLMRY